MAGSDVDIVNMALGHLGDRATVASISPPDGTAQADAAARAYPQVRDWLLERFAWKFAKRRATLAARNLTFGSWDYVYGEPNNCLRMLAILPSGYLTDDAGMEFETETDDTGQGIILTDAQDATALFIARITDPGKFSPGFVTALSWFLASELAGPIIKGETGRQEGTRCLQIAALAFESATGLSAKQSKKVLNHIPGSIAARGGVDTSGMNTLPAVIRS